jgi:hypothetical protein
MQRPRRPHALLRRNYTMLRIFVAIFAFFVALPSVCRAQVDMLVGTWQLSDTTSEIETREDAIKEISEQLPRFARGNAIDKLRNSTEPSKRLSVTFEGNQILISQDEQKVKLELDGKSVKVTAKQGAAFVSAARKDGHLVLTTKAENATRTVIFRPSKDGKVLVLDVSVHISKFDATATYQTKYVRQ